MSDWPRAVMFDFDGVLVNSEPLHFFAFQETLEAEKIHLTEAEYYRELIGFDDRGAFKHVFATRQRELDPVQWLGVCACWRRAERAGACLLLADGCLSRLLLSC